MWPRLLVGLVLCGCHEVVEVLAVEGMVGGSSGGGGEQGGVEVPVPDGSLAVSLSAGQSHTCVARGGIVFCWGDNRDGQLGLGDTQPRLFPAAIPSVSRIVQVTAGENHTCALDDAGEVFCFGSDAQGQLGRPQSSNPLVPMAVALPGPALGIDASYDHSCATLRSGELYCWGSNVETQLGQGDAPDENHVEPIRVPDLAGIVAVGCGQGHTVAMRSDGRLFTWGRNTSGQPGLGEGLPVRVRVPSEVPSLAEFQSLDVGQDSACAISSGGQLFCWGAGVDQHLGTQSDATVWTPTGVAVGQVWTSVSTDSFHSCGVNSEARLFCWGRGIEGQLGFGAFETPRAIPAQVGTAQWQTVSVGRFHTCAVGVDEKVWCSGSNGNGELGIGDTVDRDTLTEVTLP